MPLLASLRVSGVTPAQRRTLVAAALGWMLDAFDVMLYALVLTHVMRDLSMGKGTAGLLNTLTLLASGVGGVLFGFVADHVGRKRALTFSILTYSLCSFACGLSSTIPMLAAFRFLLGLGMGGEWNTGATLVAETWPTEKRAKAIALVQSSWAIGYALAAVVAAIVLHYAGWRSVFFVGVLPALLTFWILRSVPESEMWKEGHQLSRQSASGTPAQLPTTGFAQLFVPPYRKQVLALLLANFFGMFAWWGLFTWIPPYLSLPQAQGGRGFGVVGTTGLLVFLNLVGMFPGYASFGWVADHIGRRKSFISYTLVAALAVPLYAMARPAWALLLLGAVVAFFGTGFFSGSAIMGSEMFPTRVRARALGLTYNGARTMSAISPFVIGRIGQSRGLDSAFYLCALGFLLSAAAASQLPETRGKHLE